MSHTDPNRRTSDRVPVSIICVYTNSDVLGSCLQSSITADITSAPETELITVDNRSGAFKTAASALNSGAERARNPVVAFVHQDVILHSLPAMERAASALTRIPSIGMVGAAGINRQRQVIGRIRDRVVRIGEAAPYPRDVDTVDEVLFMVRRELVLREPLRDEAELAWHAYAAEYALRLRRSGLRVVALDIPLTHNSLTANLDGLDVAHQWLGATYSEMLPIVTTCGTIQDNRFPPVLRRMIRQARSGKTWWKESRLANEVARKIPECSVVLADVRLLIDDAAKLGNATEIRVIDVDRDAVPPMSVDGIDRLGRPMSAVSVPLSGVNSAIEERAEKQILLITNIKPQDLSALPALRSNPFVVGHWHDTGPWLLVGQTYEDLSILWPKVRNKPYAGFALRQASRR